MKGLEFVLMAIGAIFGAFLRYKITESPIVFGCLPLNILIVNVIGSFILGLFSVLSITWNLDPKYSYLIAIGFCGSLTTMSSFALEVDNLINDKQIILATVNVITNVGLSILGIFGGRSLASLFV